MKKFLISLMLLLATVVFTGCENASSALDNRAVENKNVASDQANVNTEIVADKLEIYYFHRTARCRSCMAIGRLVNETMIDRYSHEIKNGKIDYRELNIDDSENGEIVQKFKATGSSLFINRIINGQENIEQDTDVWRLLSDEIVFKQHLEGKINSYLNI